MLIRFLQRLRPRPRNRAETLREMREHAEQVADKGDHRSAVKLFREYLKLDPFNLPAINYLGACLASIGDNAGARAMFELAHSLDDTFVPAMGNYAKLLNEDGRAQDALRVLRRSKVCQPHFTHAHAVYAAVRFKMGRVAEARRHQVHAWLSNFDFLRHANAALFWASYDDIDEATLAAEHRFWADTLAPAPAAAAKVPSLPDKGLAELESASGRIRIGYWSPDYRDHSVRYFFRPMLEHHDLSKFEVFLYHDVPQNDAQTELIRRKAEHFFDVHELTDAELLAFMRSHRLDVLVELAGQTSHNRANLLQERLATVQITGLGYPPTTGLTTVDAKMLDAHVVTAGSARFYSEAPLVLPESFWCYDPVDDEAPLADEPPVVANGYITFGCAGNVAKITAPALAAWKQILDRLPQSRMVIRSINFEDPIAIEAMKERLGAQGLPMDRIALLKPAPKTAFYASYNEIDIALDTFPFNGGTTTCFATYMGVPVVTVSGHSLISRMGASIMTNLGAAHLVVQDFATYVERALELAGDIGFLRTFKREARQRYRASPLGNGALFMPQFEHECVQLLERKKAGMAVAAACAVPFLPAADLLRRAYAILRRDQREAASRVLAHCLRGYPNEGGAHMLVAQQMSWDGRYLDAVAYLHEHQPHFSPADRYAAALTITRLHLLAGQPDKARAALEEAVGGTEQDEFDCLQAQLYLASLGPLAQPAGPPVALPDFLFVVPCDDPNTFAAIRDNLTHRAAEAGCQVTVRRCSESAARVRSYEEALQSAAGVVVLLQKNVKIARPQFFGAVASALERADLVSFGGAHRWERLDWREDDFKHKAGSFVVASGENTDLVELQVLGLGRSAIATGLAVLDGSLLAAGPGARATGRFDADLHGAATLMEDDWSAKLAQAGVRLASHRNLGVFLDAAQRLDDRHWGEARMHWADMHDYDPFAFLREDYAALSVPVSDVTVALQVADAFLQGPA